MTSVTYESLCVYLINQLPQQILTRLSEDWETAENDPLAALAPGNHLPLDQLVSLFRSHGDLCPEDIFRSEDQVRSREIDPAWACAAFVPPPPEWRQRELLLRVIADIAEAIFTPPGSYDPDPVSDLKLAKPTTVVDIGLVVNEAENLPDKVPAPSKIQSNKKNGSGAPEAGHKSPGPASSSRRPSNTPIIKPKRPARASGKDAKMTTTPTPTIVVAPKSQLTGLVLTFFFGPLGLLYATPIGAVVMIILTVVVGIFTLGIGVILGWFLSILWSIVAITLQNRKYKSKVQAVTVPHDLAP